MSESLVEKELPKLFLSSIQKIIHGNHVDGEELTLEKSVVYPFKLIVTVDWKFSSEWENQWIAGGEASSIHSGMNLSSFNQIHEDNLRDIVNNKSRRFGFISDYKNAGPKGLIYNQKTVIHTYPTHSYQYYCENCDGNKNVNCTDCSGHGRKGCSNCGSLGWVSEYYNAYHGNGGYEQRVRQVVCDYCNGLGKRTCYSCSGSGRQKCSPCSGYGYFTYYRTTNLVAIPSNRLTLDCQEHADELCEYFAGCSLDHLYQHIYFNELNYTSISESYERFIYYGESFLTEIYLNLRSTQHHFVGYSNPPIPFIRSGIFDQLFIEEISALEKYQENNKISKEKALKFFNEFSGQPVLERTLRNIAKSRTCGSQDNTPIVQKECSYFITQNSAQRLADGINAILDKVAPAYNGTIWIISALIYFLSIGIYVEYYTEAVFLFGKLELCLELIVYLFFTLLIYCLYGVVVAILSMFICMYKSRNVPKEFRQKFRNKEPLISTALFGSFFIICVGVYGYASSNTTWIPKIGPTLLNYSFKSASYIIPTHLIREYCKKEDPTLIYRKEKLICGSKYFIDRDKYAYYKLLNSKIIKGNPVTNTQKFLKAQNFDIVIDGKYGVNVKMNKMIDEYLATYGMTYDQEHLSLYQALARMKIAKEMQAEISNKKY